MADVNIIGVVAIVVFYVIILAVGLWAARKRKEGEEESMLAGRSIGMFVGTFTMTGNQTPEGTGEGVREGEAICTFWVWWVRRSVMSNSNVKLYFCKPT